MRRANLNSWLLAAPLTGVLVVFLILPILLITAVSFWTADEFSFRPDFQFGNYEYLFGSAVAWKVFGLTFMMTVIVWALTLVIGFTIAFFLAFHVRTQKW